MRYIKNIYGKGFILAVILLLSFSSCNEDDILKETPLDFLSPENLYSNAIEMEQAVFGLHESFRELLFKDQQRGHVFRGSGKDVSFYGISPGGGHFTNYDLSMQPTETTFVLWVWERLYKMVGRANYLIRAIEETEITDEIWIGKEEERAIDLAEAKFFRAWNYRALVTLWGDVPLLTEPIISVRTDFTRAPKADVYSLILADLEFASQNLPNPRSEKGPGRINKAAALQLLAEVYLALDRPEDAITATSSIINDFGLALMQERFGNQYSYEILKNGGDVYWDLFRYGNQNISANTEGMWVIQYEPDTDGGGLNGSVASRTYGPQYWAFGNGPDGVRAIIGDNPDATSDIYLEAFGRGAAFATGTRYVNYDIWESDWDNDIRNSYHNIFRDWRYNNPASAFYGQPIDFVNDWGSGGRANLMTDTTKFLYPNFMKTDAPGVRFTDPNRQGGGSHHVDAYAMRLPETLLTRAEAYLEVNNKVAAAADINEIRNRAQATPVAPENVDIDYILDERARELFSEEFRLITLHRMGLAVERTLKYNGNPAFPAGTGQNIKPHHNLWPIPQSEIDLNVDAVLTQNPGYE